MKSLCIKFLLRFTFTKPKMISATDADNYRKILTFGERKICEGESLQQPRHMCKINFYWINGENIFPCVNSNWANICKGERKNKKAREMCTLRMSKYSSKTHIAERIIVWHRRKEWWRKIFKYFQRKRRRKITK